MKRIDKIYLVGFVFVVSFIIFFSSIYFNSKLVLQEFELPITLEISNKSGFDLNTTVLTLGRLNVGSSTQREIMIDNPYNYTIFAYLHVEGSVKDLLIFEKRIEILRNESKKVAINTVVIEYEPFGNYTGVLFVKIRKS